MELTLEHRVAILENALANLVRIGSIAEVDYSGAVPKARVQIGILKTTWLALPAIRAGGDVATWLLEVGEQVVVLAPGGDLAQAVISHALHRTDAASTTTDANIAKLRFSDGSIVEMNRTSGILTLDPITKLVVNSDMDLNGNLTHVGNVLQTGDRTQVGDEEQTGNRLQTGGATVIGVATFTGNLDLTGDINQTGTHTSTGDQIAGGISLSGHKHQYHPGSGSLIDTGVAH